MSKLPTTSRRFTKTPEVATTSLSRRIRGPGGCPLTFVGDFKRRSVFDGRKDKPLLGPPGREVQERPQAHRAELPPPAVASSGWQIGTPRFPRRGRNKNPARVQRTEGALKIAT